MYKYLLKLSLFLIAFMIYLPLQASANDSMATREDVFNFLESAFHAQVSLSEELRSYEEVETILNPYFTKEYNKVFLGENLVNEDGQYVTYGSDFAPYFIPFYQFSNKTKVAFFDNEIYVFEFFEANDSGPVAYQSHYEGLLLNKAEGKWKVAEYLYDQIPEHVKESVEKEEIKDEEKLEDETESQPESQPEGEVVSETVMEASKGDYLQELTVSEEPKEIKINEPEELVNVEAKKIEPKEKLINHQSKHNTIVTLGNNEQDHGRFINYHVMTGSISLEPSYGYGEMIKAIDFSLAETISKNDEIQTIGETEDNRMLFSSAQFKLIKDINPLIRFHLGALIWLETYLPFLKFYDG